LVALVTAVVVETDLDNDDLCCDRFAIEYRSRAHDFHIVDLSSLAGKLTLVLEPGW